MSDTHSTTTSYEVTINGKKLRQPDGKGVESLTMEDHVDMVESLTLKLGGLRTSRNGRSILVIPLK